MERLAYAILIVVALAWLYGMVRGMIELLPYGLIGLAALVGIGLLFAKVVKERVENTEDDHYSKTVDR